MTFASCFKLVLCRKPIGCHDTKNETHTCLLYVANELVAKTPKVKTILREEVMALMQNQRNVGYTGLIGGDFHEI